VKIILSPSSTTIVQLLHAVMGRIYLIGVLCAHSSFPGSTSSNDAKFLLRLPK